MADRSMPLGPYAAVFAPLNPEGRAEAVTRRLGEAIALGVLPDGSMLPSESDLADRFGVATVTVREALGVLREHELIHTRRGRGGGSFVRAPVDGGRAALLTRLGEVGLGDLRDLADHYAAISGMCAYLAADRADPADVARLGHLAEATSTDTDPASAPRGEGNFHLELAASAQSARLTREEMALQREIGPLLWMAHAETRRGGSATHHAAIVAAIADADRDRARRHAEEHVRELFESVKLVHRQARSRRAP